ncbi:NADH-quinone oxidoreductase subunit C [Bradyrhizobium manausense]|uniref:hydrogenase large subunit n=1 Tax=Bradyrhizobium TaxID=374 RepID=UPI001BA91934|nr:MULTISPECIES: NADH-quinone oxidoreductase subunit C [Bradyrhizobium]MBR0825458.1 NADH-quinone oxidoreductase subunit C [Bradyrhizobium manausense]UVO30062.1 NADH-quinone oxidoreductase subunit C [Bradyrhizobium arachidis]
MGLLDHIPHQNVVPSHRPWPRIVVADEGWRAAIDQLVAGRATLLGFWGEPEAVHMALCDVASAEIAVVTYECMSGSFPSVAIHHPPALRLERTIHDLFGLMPLGAGDMRPWLDHYVWGKPWPLGDRDAARDAVPYDFLPAEGEGLHQVAVGPVHAGIIEPGHFRFTANGEHVVRLEQWLGYTHKGIESLMQGASLEAAAKLACRTSGDSAVAYAFAFARAVEAALQIEAPARASLLRALMAELERLANHFGDIGAICNDASFALMHAQTGILRERCLRAANVAFDHRLMMDVIVPGGVARDMTPEALPVLRALLAEIKKVFPRLVELYDNTASLQDRTVTTGIVKADYVRQFGAGGYVGRASGRDFDARRTLACAPYDSLSFEVPVLEAGDVNARVWIRIREVEQSVALIEQILDRLEPGAIRTAPPAGHGPCEGMALSEAFRGDVLVWLRLDGELRIERCHLRDASWFQWPLLETAIEGNIIADFPLCNKSFNCSYSGADL